MNIGERRFSLGRRIAAVIAVGAVMLWGGAASATAQAMPPVSGAAGTAATCIMSGVDASICVDAAVASVVAAPVAVPGLPLQADEDMTIDKNGGHEVEQD